MIRQAENPLVVVRDLKTHFPVSGGLFRKLRVRAVDGVSFSIPAGRTMALVGESGSGKTTVGRTLLRLIPATSGQVVFDGVDLLALSGRRMRALRRRMQMIFQDPVSSLNPRMTVGGIVGEPLKVHGLCGSRKQRRQRIGQLLRRVGLEPGYAGRYPHEFSGGQRQRIGIARALASEPDFIVCDEPVSALDVSIQSQILNLLKDLQGELGLTYLFIAHNLAVVEQFADVVAVMYLGKLLEVADRDELYSRPTHPYTEALLSAAPVIEAATGDPSRRGRDPDGSGRRARIRLEGETPSPIRPPSGCVFHTRCWLTRQVASGRAAGNAKVTSPPLPTCRIQTQGGSVSVVRKCVEEVPELRGSPDRPEHLHACHLRR